MQIITIMNCHLTRVRLIIIKMMKDNKFWQRCGEKGTLIPLLAERLPGIAIMENSMEVPQKIKNKNTI